jgi:hypothetical protein
MSDEQRYHVDDRLQSRHIQGTPDHVQACLTALSQMKTDDENTTRLAQGIRTALRYIAEGHSGRYPEFEELTWWTHVTYVRSYFQRIAKDFETNPYYHEE